MNNAWQERDDELQAARWGCRIFGWDVGIRRISPDDRPWKTAVHETGHALVALLVSGTFSEVVIEAGERDGRRFAGHLLGGRFATDDDNIACTLGGAVGEIVAIGSLDPYGCLADFESAIELALRDPDAEGDAYEAALERGARQASRVLSMLTPRRELVLQLARALTHHKTMGFDLFQGIVLKAEAEADPRRAS
jgi:hypothetical protein